MSQDPPQKIPTAKEIKASLAEQKLQMQRWNLAVLFIRATVYKDIPPTSLKQRLLNSTIISGRWKLQ